MNVVAKFEWVLLSVGVAILPIYIFSSGGVQPSHMVLAIFSGVVFLERSLPQPPWAQIMAAIFVYVLVVESFYTIFNKDPENIINAAFFFYNLLIASAVYGYCSRKGFSAVAVGLCFAAALAVGTVAITGVDLREFGETGRSTGSFNNPNQLGYFSVCILSITYLLYRNGSFGYLIATTLFAAAIFLSIVSLSKAAMAANALVIFLAITPKMSRKALVLWGTVVAAVIGVLVWMFLQGSFDEYLFTQRFRNLSGESDSSLASRGYLAFLNGSLSQIIFGLGAQNVDDIVGHEVHSTFGSMLNNYGLVGLSLFAGVMFIWARQMWWTFGFTGLICIAGPSLAYGITHNGVRFTAFWVLLALSFAIIKRARPTRSFYPRQVSWGQSVPTRPYG